MNKAQRKRIATLIEELQGISSALAECSSIEDIQSTIEEICDEEQEKLDNMPEGLRNGDKGSELETKIEALSEAKSIAEEMVDWANRLDEIIAKLEEASE
jgi:methyl-accepting chemotaxis protein